MAFKDKNELEAGDPEDEFRSGAFPLESTDSESLDEESSDDEFAELSEEEMRPFTLAEWQQSIPDYTAHEFEEKLPERTRESWMAPVFSCLGGTGLSAVIAGLLVNDLPKPQEARAFFIFLLVLAPLFSCIWHWFLILQPKRVAKKMEDEQENLVDAEPIQQVDPVGPEPIHPK